MNCPAEPPILLDLAPKPTPLNDALAALGVEVRRSLPVPGELPAGAVAGCMMGFYDYVSRPWRAWKLKRVLGPGVPVIAWNRDAPGYLNKRPWRLALASRLEGLDIYATHAITDDWRFGKEVALLHNGASIAAYNLAGRSLESLRDEGNYRYDVTFFGAMNADRYKEYLPRERFFGALAQALESRGINYRFIDTSRTPMSVAEQVELVQTSRININYGAGCEYGAPMGYGLPERCFGIPACGGFLLSDYRLHAADAFAADEWADYTDLEQALQRIDYYLGNFAEARAIAERAYRRVLACHSYRHRAEELLALLADWRRRHGA